MGKILLTSCCSDISQKTWQNEWITGIIAGRDSMWRKPQMWRSGVPSLRYSRETGETGKEEERRWPVRKRIDFRYNGAHKIIWAFAGYYNTLQLKWGAKSDGGLNSVTVRLCVKQIEGVGQEQSTRVRMTYNNPGTDAGSREGKVEESFPPASALLIKMSLQGDDDSGMWLG